MSIIGRPSFAFLLLPVFTLPVLVGCHHDVAQVDEAPATVTGLQLAEVHSAQVPEASPVVGTVQAKESASLSAQVVGRVSAVLVHEGDSVRAGQVLVRIDNAQARAGVDQAQGSVSAAQHQLDAAKSQAALAASTLRRYEMLRDQKSVSPQEFEEVSRRSEQASAQLASAQATLGALRASASSANVIAGYSTITAPFTGVVTARHVDPGALAAPGVPLVDIDRASALQLAVTVNESLLNRVQQGSVLSVSIPAAGPDSIMAHIAQIVPSADASSHSFLVKLDLPNSSHLKAGMYGTASLGGAMRSAIVAPQSAIVAHGSIHSVWVVDSQHLASLRYVSLGLPIGPDFEVLTGLSAGEQVVLSPGDRELGGSRIETRP
ncbi:MAG: efflux RND transporter periplasmic adaptor subunit [Acidobacteria bacterium]|nr:efflux RND transporter periplasmic adaptor subunit [Acidobacteriota bacterium]